MKKINKTLTLVLAAFVALTFTACSKTSPVQELSRDFSGYLQDKFDVSEDDVKEYAPGEFHNANAFEGKYYICVDADMPAIECCIYDDANEAHEVFASLYNDFNEGFNEDAFEGEYQTDLQKDSGYIVVNGANSGTDVFGDVYRFGEPIYAGIYYDGNTVLFIMPRNVVSPEDVENVIATMKLPMANGENT